MHARRRLRAAGRHRCRCALPDALIGRSTLAVAALGGKIDVQAILDFIDSGKNVILGLSSEVSESMRTLAAEVGVEVDEKGSAVYDHFHAAGEATTIYSSQVIDAPIIVGASKPKPVTFKGVAHAVAGDSELVTVVLSAEATAYSHDPRKPMLEPPNLIAGKAVSLLSVVQARNNARVMVAGSVDMLTDGHFSSSSGNQQVCVGAAVWTFQGAGAIKAENVRHAVRGSNETNPGTYRVNDEVEFKVDIFEHTPSGRKPYQADDVQVRARTVDRDEHQRVVGDRRLAGGEGRDRGKCIARGAWGARQCASCPVPSPPLMIPVSLLLRLLCLTATILAPHCCRQIEFRMLDPYVRLTMKHDGRGTYSVSFKVPDVYGVFKYSLHYKHLGFSYIDLEQVVPVRPYRHNEYPRFLTCAYPYYASAVSTMAAFFVLGLYFLYHK